MGQRVLDSKTFNRKDNESNRVGIVERLIRFPNLVGIETLPEGGFSVIFVDCINLAKKNKELPRTVSTEKAVLSLACLFYGVPMMVSDRSAAHLSEKYSEQLRIIWKGLGGKI
jgi:hypothetical protein